MPKSFLLKRHSQPDLKAKGLPNFEEAEKVMESNIFPEEKLIHGWYEPEKGSHASTKFQDELEYRAVLMDRDTFLHRAPSDVSDGLRYEPASMVGMEKDLDYEPENASFLELPRSKHEVKQTGNKPIHQCNQCGKTFKTKYTLNIHLKMPSHTMARPFVCGICGKGFRLSSTLCRHKIIHTSEKPHKCHICGKAFNRSSTLKTHIRTHSEVKEFTCDICGKGFHQKGNLRNHLLIHTGEKPYHCNICQKAFNKLSNLKFHLHVHTDNTPYRCRFCKMSFTRRCDLKTHISSMHQEERLNEDEQS